MMRYSLPSILISWPEYLPNRMVSPALTSSGVFLPSLSGLPAPTATTLPCWGFSLARVGDDDAADLLFAFLDALDEDAVVQWTQLRCHIRDSGQFNLRPVRAAKSGCRPTGPADSPAG